MKIGNIKENNFELIVKSNTSDDFSHLTLINGLYIKEGGTIITYLLDSLIPAIKNNLPKTYRDKIKPGDIKNKIKLYVNIRFFKNLQFNSQTKERVTNSKKEFNKIFEEIDWDKIAKRLLKDKEFKDNIIEYYKIKEEFQQRKELKKTQKKVKRIVSDKYIPATKRKEYILLTEGASALSSCLMWFGRENFGYIEMMGVPMNIWEENVTKIANSKKFELIQQVLEIDYINKVSNSPYKYIVLATDSDIFGSKISALMMAYFYKFAKNLFDSKRICLLKTPIILAYKNNRLIEWFYDFVSYKEFEKKHLNENIVYEYNKGLGSSDADIMKIIIEKDGLENIIIPIELSKKDESVLENWFSKNKSDIRKELVLQNPFNINLL